VDAVDPVPVVAAGGIGNGRGLVASLALGACGALIGTRFVASKESTELEFHKKKIVGATEEDTRITRIVSGKPLRAINNKMIEIWDASGIETLPMPLQFMLMMQLNEGLLQTEMMDYLTGLAGQVSGMIDEVKNASEIMEEIINEAVEILGKKFPSEVIIKG
jgi:nitronate monooxygenase